MRQQRQQKARPTTRKRYRKRRTQSGSFLTRHYFAYAGRDTVNQRGKFAPGIIKNASSEINNVAQQIINKIISQGGGKK